jgi:metal-dependent amidase/aminoacylase/carboxypeptidase family protein
MYLTSKALKEHMVSAGCGWSMNECILTAGQATADNLPAQIAQIQYIMRVPTIDMAERITGILDSNAAAAATVSHCRWRRDWVSKSRHGLANHALAQATYDNLKLVGAPKFNHGRARQKARYKPTSDSKRWLTRSSPKLNNLLRHRQRKPNCAGNCPPGRSILPRMITPNTAGMHPR